MKVTTKKAAFGGLAMFGAAVLLAGCASAPEESRRHRRRRGLRLPALHGLRRRRLRRQVVQPARLRGPRPGGRRARRRARSRSSPTPRPTTRRNLTNLVDQGCNLIVTVGFALAAAAGESAEENPDIEYVSIDDAVDDDFDGTTDSENIKPIVFDTAQAAFLAGYAAAGYSKTGVVGTFGGMNFPTVTIFMDGFAQGVDYYNEREGHDRQGPRLGRHRTASSPVASRPTTPRASTAQGLIDQNVDVLLPVGGPIYQSAAAAIRDSGREIALIGVDADFFETDPSVGRPHADLDPQGHRRRHVRGRRRRPATVSSTTRRSSARSRTRASASRRSTTSSRRSPPTLQGELDDLKADDHRRRRRRSSPTSPQ